MNNLLFFEVEACALAITPKLEGIDNALTK